MGKVFNVESKKREEVVLMGIVHPFSNVAGIFFTVGKLEDDGTCEFATKICLKECAAFKNATADNKIPFCDKEHAVNCITEGDIYDVVFQIAEEVRKLNSDILYWFASGDCPSKYTQRIADVIERCSSVIPVQLGFTRNEELWEKVNELNNVRMVLTMERLNKSRVQRLSTHGVIAVPNYDTGDIKLYKNKCSIGGCGGNIAYFEHLGETIKRKADCRTCFEKKIGCFLDFEEAQV